LLNKISLPFGKKVSSVEKVPDLVKAMKVEEFFLVLVVISVFPWYSLTRSELEEPEAPRTIAFTRFVFCGLRAKRV
jgi:hypothetical protein